MVQTNAIRVRLAVAELVNRVFTNVQANMAALARRKIIGILLPIANYPQFILNQYQEVNQKPAHKATQRKNKQTNNRTNKRLSQLKIKLP